MLLAARGAHSLALQSHSQPDGYGIGAFAEDGTPHVERSGHARVAGRRLRARRQAECSRAYVVPPPLHVVGPGGAAQQATRSCWKGRLFAHNGVFEGAGRARGPPRARPRAGAQRHGLRALLRARSRARRGAPAATRPASPPRPWIAARLPMFSLNLVLATPDELWALRYPDTNELWLLERRAGGPHGCRHLRRVERGRHAARALRRPRSVRLGRWSPPSRWTERPDWRPLDPVSSCA